MQLTIDNLTPKYDYSKENSYLVFTHNSKRYVQKEINAEWFDFNYGGQFIWLLVRLKSKDSKETKYKNIKLENISKMVTIRKVGE